MFKIDKGGRPMPAPRSPRALYPFADMAVGDSFDCPRDMGVNYKGSDRRQHAVKSSIKRHYKKFPNKEFTVRCIDKDTVRCIRIK